MGGRSPEKAVAGSWSPVGRFENEGCSVVAAEEEPP
jgi:hypothetical protein